MSEKRKRPPASRPASQKTASERQAGRKDFNVVLHELWHGKIPLMQAFWLYFFSALFALRILANILPGFGNLFLLFQMVWAGFMVKPIMVAADKYKGPAYWAVAAKVAAVVIAAGIAFDVLFYGN